MDQWHPLTSIPLCPDPLGFVNYSMIPTGTYNCPTLSFLSCTYDVEHPCLCLRGLTPSPPHTFYWGILPADSRGIYDHRTASCPFITLLTAVPRARHHMHHPFPSPCPSPTPVVQGCQINSSLVASKLVLLFSSTSHDGFACSTCISRRTHHSL